MKVLKLCHNFSFQKTPARLKERRRKAIRARSLVTLKITNLYLRILIKLFLIISLSLSLSLSYCHSLQLNLVSNCQSHIVIVYNSTWCQIVNPFVWMDDIFIKPLACASFQ